jgi:hypothetical protein
MAHQMSASQPEPGEAWIDSIEHALAAQAQLFASGLRLWRRLTVALVQTAAGLTAETATATARSATEAASNASEAAGKATESITESLAEGTRRVQQKAEKAQQPVRA